MNQLMGLTSILACGLGVSLGGDGPSYRYSTEELDYFETPKPLTKRQKRRLKGKAS